MQAELMFDHKLAEKMKINDNEEARQRFLWQKKWLSKVKMLAIIMYYFIVPFLQTPRWCLTDA